MDKVDGAYIDIRTILYQKLNQFCFN